MKNRGNEKLVCLNSDIEFYIGALRHELRIGNKTFYRSSIKNQAKENEICFHLTKSEYDSLSDSASMYYSYGASNTTISAPGKLSGERKKSSPLQSEKSPNDSRRYKNFNVGKLNKGAQ